MTDTSSIQLSDAPNELGATQSTFSATIPFSNGPEVAQLQFLLVCTNIPSGSQVAFSAAAPNDGGPGFNPIALPWTTVPVPPGGAPGSVVPQFAAGMQTEVIASYNSDITYEYRANGYPTPAGFNLSMQVLIMVDENNATRAMLDSPTIQLSDQT